MRSSKTGRKISSVASAELHVAPSCWNQMLPISSSHYDPITIAIDCNGLSLLICEEKLPNYVSGPKSAPNSNSFWVHRLFNVCVWVFCASKCDNFPCLHTRQDHNELQLKRWFFFAKIRIFCKSIAGPLHTFVQTYTQPHSFGGRIKLTICQIRYELSVNI